MIVRYIDAAIRQARERARILKTKMPNPLPSPEVLGLQQLCNIELDNVIETFDYLLQDPTITALVSMRQRIRIFRRTLTHLTELETIAIAALNRVNKDDIVMNKLVFQIHKEISYPLEPPVVTCLSRDYFYIIPSFHLLHAHLAESDFLLHLPDLYHELAHPLLLRQNNPQLEPLQQEFLQFLNAVAQYFHMRRVENDRSTGPREYFALILDILEESWMRWAHELFCDLYATYTLGPAYGWAHFHLTASREGDPYYVATTTVTTHPPDHARMEVVLLALETLGFHDEATAIGEKWEDLLKNTGSKATNDYRKACPRELLVLCVRRAFEGTKRIGSRIAQKSTAGSVHELLNNAWEQFWADSDKFYQWERTAITSLKCQLLGHNS